jgi:hypothetical protein
MTSILINAILSSKPLLPFDIYNQLDPSWACLLYPTTDQLFERKAWQQWHTEHQVYCTQSLCPGVVFPLHNMRLRKFMVTWQTLNYSSISNLNTNCTELTLLKVQITELEIQPGENWFQFLETKNLPNAFAITKQNSRFKSWALHLHLGLEIQDLKFRVKRFCEEWQEGLGFRV